MTRRLTRLLTPERQTIVSNSSFLVATTVVTAGLGFVFWWVAARRYSAQEVGVAAAAVSAMTLLGYVATLGFGTLLIAELHRRGDNAMAYVSTALMLSSVAGLFLGVAAVFAAPLASTELAGFARNESSLLLFPLGVAVAAASLVADQALIGLLRGGTQFFRNAAFAVSKLVLLAGVAAVSSSGSSTTIFGTWVAGLIASMLLLTILAVRRERMLRRYRPDAEILHHLGQGMLKHHALNMAVQAPSLAMPVLVAAALSATEAGYFYAASMIAGFVSVAAPALGITLYAVGSRSPARLLHAMRMTLALSFLITGAGCLVAIMAGGALLGTFGPGYASEGTKPLIVLALATLPLIVKVHFIQVQRIADRIGSAAAIFCCAAVLEVAAAGIGARQGGLIGLSTWYLAVVLVEAVLMLPSVLSAAGLGPRRPQSSPERLSVPVAPSGSTDQR
jgi:O-antigen/teichoic acid export membrane protein